jgi:hypothetical protein
LAVLEMHEEQWSENWLRREVLDRTRHPRDRLLVIFDLFDEWFGQPDFLGCPFTRVLLETQPGSPAHEKAEAGMRRIREFLVALARDAALDQPERLAAVWHLLMKGCVVAAHEGQTAAARDAKDGARRLLECWPNEAAR